MNRANLVRINKGNKVIMFSPKLSVLHVDDNSDFLLITKYIIKKFLKDIELETVSSPVQALKKIESNHYDVVISDFNMPEMDGLEFFRILKNKGVSSPFIWLTGGVSSDVLIDSINLGIHYYFEKGPNIQLILKNLCQILSEICDQNRLKTEEEQQNYILELNHKKYFNLFNKVNDAIFLLELNDKGFPIRILEVNETACQRYGYSRSELLKMSPLDIIEKEEVHKIPEILQKYVEKGDLTFEITHMTKNGLKIPVEINAHIYQINGKKIGVSIVRDITKRNQALELLQKQKKELSEFAHSMTHDLNQSLTVIQGYATFFKDVCDNSLVKIILQQVQNMSSILDRSLELADAGQVINANSEVNLNALINEIAAVIIIPRGIKIVLDLLPTLIADRDKLHQIFQNLFLNAVVHGKPNQIEIRRRELGSFECILISNDGQTIPQDVQPKIFERGFSTKAEKKGGFGLYLVKKLVEAHGWQVRLKSALETTFEICIPKNQVIL